MREDISSRYVPYKPYIRKFAAGAAERFQEEILNRFGAA